MIKKFRKKPVEIEAVQFNGDILNGNYNDIIGFVGKKLSYSSLTKTIEIPTLEGTMTASDGDWIIKGVSGEFYPCKSDIFEKSYEPVKEYVYDDSDSFADWEKG